MALRLSRLLVALLLCAAALPAWAVQRALLVGVSELVNQPQALWLQAPRNDVMLMRDTLLKQGFAAADITMLADGVSGAALPEAQRIHQALGRLLAQSKSGDFVLLYFSGHGTRLRDATKRYQEPDGLAENFLARDVRGVVGGAATLGGGVRDVDFDAWISAFLARNVFVWSVFDTCSAASMTRGVPAPASALSEPADDEVRFRGVRIDQLVGSLAGAAGGPAAPASTATPRARYVAFFASESHQVTPELRLPRHSRAGRPQGLLTWAVSEALQRRPATWRALFDGVLALYPPVIDELETRFPDRELPSPVAEGNLDMPLFANGALAATTRPVWRAQRTGGNLLLNVGALDGLEAQQELRVAATLADGTQPAATAQLEELGLDSARLSVPAALQAASAVAWSVSPVAAPASVALRVRADGPLPGGLNLEYPASVRVVREGEADLRWPAGRADDDAARRELQTQARLKWYARLQELARESRLDGFEAVLELREGDRLVRTESLRGAGAAANPLRPGERAELVVRNLSGHSLDMVIVGVDAQGAIRPVYPEDSGETNRFERGTREAPAAKRFAMPWMVPGTALRLFVLASPAQALSAPRLFGLGRADGSAEIRVRGQAAPERERQVYAALLNWGRPAP